MSVGKEEVKELFSKTPYEIKKGGGYKSDYTATMSKEEEQQLPIAGQIITELIFKFSDNKESSNFYLKERIYCSNRPNLTLWEISTDNMEELQQKAKGRFRKNNP